MMKLFDSMRISRQLALLTATMLAILFALMLGDVFEAREALMADRLDDNRTVVMLARQIVETWHLKEVKGELSRADAQASAIAQLRELRYGPAKDYIFIQGYDGTALLNPGSPKLEGQKRLDAVDADGVPNVRRQIEAAKAGGDFVWYRFPRVQGEPPLQKVSFVVPVAEWQWAVASGVYLDDVDAVFQRSLIRLAISTVLAAALCIAVSLFVVRSVRNPIRQLSTVIDRLGHGVRDITVPYVTAKNEISALARAIQSFQLSLAEAERLVDEHAKTQVQLMSHEKQQALSKRFAERMDRITGRLTRSADHLAGQANGMAGAADIAVSGTETVGASSSAAADTVLSISSSVGHLNDSVGAITRAVTDATRAAKDAVAQTHVAKTDVDDLAHAVQEIRAINDLVSTIAAQTNLLALNAAIEAARAGDAGRGFSIVATEVKALATQTAEATSSIQTQVSTVLDRTAKVLDTMEAVTRIIGTIDDHTTAVSDQVGQQAQVASAIAKAADAAASSASSARVGVAGVAVEVRQTRVNAGEVLTAAQELSTQSQDLAESVSTFLKDLQAA
jgi:methyl-accepting chemotaxis protein